MGVPGVMYPEGAFAHRGLATLVTPSRLPFVLASLERLRANHCALPVVVAHAGELEAEEHHRGERGDPADLDEQRDDVRAEELACGDVGRCGEMWRDVGRCGEMWRDWGR